MQDLHFHDPQATCIVTKLEAVMHVSQPCAVYGTRNAMQHCHIEAVLIFDADWVFIVIS